MKKILALLLTTIASTSLFASQGAVLSIATVLPVALEVQVDGYSYKANENAITIQNLASGHHSVAVFSSDSFETRLVYNQTVQLKDGYHFDITINRFGTAMMDERILEPSSVQYEDTMIIYPMTDYEFNQAKATIRAEWFDDSREIVAKQIIDLNYFTTDQVIEILKCFSYDDAKLALAKYAYSKTTDKNNYYLLNKVFTFSWSKEELANYIRNYR